MNNAVEFVISGGTVYKACKEYGVPQRTLERRILNGAPNKSGRKPFLTSFEEEELVKYIKYMSKTGHPVTPCWVGDTASRLVACG